MSISEQKRQRKLAKKHAKDSQRRKKLVLQQQQMSSLAGKMMSASHGKILFTGVSDSIQSQGIGYVTIVRQGPDGLQAMATLLIDSYCLGVKDVAAHLAAPAQLSDMIDQLKSRGMVSMKPGVLRALVDGAVAYARPLGFEPHPDYRKVACLLDDIEPESIEGLYSFGRDGRPCYINGPYDDASKQRMILNRLDHSVGRGNYDFVHLSDGSIGGFDEDEFEIVEDWRPGSIDGEVHRIDQ